jgi:hypothetical protein
MSSWQQSSGHCNIAAVASEGKERPPVAAAATGLEPGGKATVPSERRLEEVVRVARVLLRGGRRGLLQESGGAATADEIEARDEMLASAAEDSLHGQRYCTSYKSRIQSGIEVPPLVFASVFYDESLVILGSNVIGPGGLGLEWHS